MTWKLTPLPVVVSVIFLLGCSNDVSYEDVVPEGAGPEDVVTIWFETFEKRDRGGMRALFDPASQMYESAKFFQFPEISMSNVVLETTSSTDDRVEIFTEFDAKSSRDIMTHSSTVFTLSKVGDGTWRITSIGSGTGIE